MRTASYCEETIVQDRQILRDRQILYVGINYLIYVGPGHYPWTRSIAPALLWGPPQGLLRIKSGRDELTASVLAHRAQGCSASASERTALAYFDPVSTLGQAIQALTKQEPLLPLPPERLGDEFPKLMPSVFAENVEPSQIHRLVASLRCSLVDCAPDIDPRILEAFQKSEMASGDFSLVHAARRAGLAPSYYRKLFRRALGFGIAEYRVWRRFHEGMRRLCHASGNISARELQLALSAANFYDESHIAKFFHAYLGPKQDYRSVPLFVVDCRQADV